MINNKILGLIGLAMKAGKVCFGADSVEENMLKKKVKLVIISEESSERTKNKFINLSKKNDVSVIVYGKIEDLSKAIGKSNKAIIGIKDSNFAKSIQKINNGGEIIG